MQTREIAMSVCAATLAATTASAGVVFNDAAEFAAQTGAWDLAGFESSSAGERVTAISFESGLIASVTSDAPVNRIIDTHDGYGAIAAEGDMFWKLRGGSTTLSFGDAPLSAFGFWYSDKEQADVAVSFDTGESFDLTDRNPHRATFFGFAADDGNAIRSVTFRWDSSQNDGVGFDGLTAARIPAPPVYAAMALAGLVVAGARARARS